MRSIHLLFVVPLTMMVAACSSTPPYEGTPLGGTHSRAGEATDEDPSADSSALDTAGLDDGTSAPASKEKAKGACAGETTQKACFECCSAKAPGAVDIYTTTLQGCLCQSPGSCKTACADTLCAGFTANAACADCLRVSGSACEDKAFSTCEKDGSCAPLLTCTTDSRCSSK